MTAPTVFGPILVGVGARAGTYPTPTGRGYRTLVFVTEPRRRTIPGGGGATVAAGPGITSMASHTAGSFATEADAAAFGNLIAETLPALWRYLARTTTDLPTHPTKDTDR